jgi:hypothetical protein
LLVFSVERMFYGYVPNLTSLLTFVNVSQVERTDEGHQVWL